MYERVGTAIQRQANVLIARAVVAAKRDLFGRDLLCLFFETRPGGVIEVDESLAGWQDLLNALPARLPGALKADDWVARVLFPAFAESPVEIFARGRP